MLDHKLDNKTHKYIDWLFQKAIKHWEQVKHDPLHEPIGSAWCAFCREAVSYTKKIDKHSRCHLSRGVPCPIYEHTGVPYCDKTPYYDMDKWQDKVGVIQDKDPDGNVPPQVIAEGKDTAQAEIDFLDGLHKRFLAGELYGQPKD